MNKHFFSQFLLVCSTCFAVEDKGQEEVKLAIQKLQKQLEGSKNDQALLLDLAKSLFKDQQEYESLSTFAHLLDVAKPSLKAVSEEEKKRFSYFLKLYFEGADFYEELEAEIKKRRDFTTLGFLLASKYANERKYDQFYDLFFTAYRSCPAHYMADKSRGVLASLLMQKAVLEEQKAVWRKEAITYFKRASEKEPGDLSIHAMLIMTASQEEKRELVHFCVNQILLSGTVVPRTLIPAYVGYCLDVRDKELAKLFLQKAASWYEYSRIIQQMQNVVAESR